MGYWDTHPVVENAIPLPAAFIPVFRDAYMFDGSGNTWPVNVSYFADKNTAQHIADKYGDGQVYEAPFPGAGGPYGCSANIYVFRVKAPNGQITNAGVIAAYYTRNPEATAPGVADKLIRMVLGLP